jgi:hypothetical protein
MEKTNICELNGIIVDENIRNSRRTFSTAECEFNVIGEGVYILKKEPTLEYTPFCWFGFNFTPLQQRNTLSFDIMFTSNIPDDNFYIFTETSNYNKGYKKWLNFCKKLQFVHIEIPLYLETKPQNIIWNMDHLFDGVGFIIKNVNLIPEYTKLSLELDVDDSIYCDGIVINYIVEQGKTHQTSNGCYFNVLPDGTYEFTKPETIEKRPYQWFCYQYTPENEFTTLSFDIMFLTEVPVDNFDFYITCDTSKINYYKWVNLCKKNKFVRVNVLLSLKCVHQHITWLMDDYVPEVMFKIKNIEITPGILEDLISLDTRDDAVFINGIIVNDLLNEDKMKNIYYNNSFVFKFIENNVYEINKKETKEKEKYQWFGMEFTPENKENTLSFDIKFISDVPELDGSLHIYTDSSEKFGGFVRWLNFCEKDKFVRIEIPIKLLDNEINQILWIMDEALTNIHFIIKNIECVPGIKEELLMIDIDDSNYLNGIFIEDIALKPVKSTIYTNDCSLKIIDENFYEFKKPKTDESKKYQWISYNLLPKKKNMVIEFDIMFLSDIPRLEDNLYININNTLDKKYKFNKWLKKCKKGEFVNIKINVSIDLSPNSVTFIMDECLKDIHFQIKNMDFYPGREFYFLSFYSQGPPYDNGEDMTESYKIHKEMVSPYFDHVHFYNAQELINDEETRFLMVEYKDIPSPRNVGSNLLGFNLWRSYTMKKCLAGANNGDIVVFRDGNALKYTDYLYGLSEIQSTIDYVLELNDTDIFIAAEEYPYLKQKHYVKRELLEKYGEYNDYYLETFLLNTSIIVVRKSDLSVKLINEWYDTCKENDREMLKTSCDLTRQHRDFRWHTLGMSVLNVLIRKYIKNGEIPHCFPMLGYTNSERKFTIRDLKRVLKLAILMPGDITKSTQFSSYIHNNKNLFHFYDTDIFISTWGEQSDFDFSNYRSVCGVNIENYQDWENSLSEEYKEIYKMCEPGPNSYFSKLYKIYDAFNLKSKFEKKKNFEYDAVVYFNPNLCLLEPIPEKYLKLFINNERDQVNKLWTYNPPRKIIKDAVNQKVFRYKSGTLDKLQSDNNSINDILFYGDKDAMSNVCSTWEKLPEIVNNEKHEKIDFSLLNLQAAKHNSYIFQITDAIGEIYEGETFEEFFNKVKYDERK